MSSNCFPSCIVPLSKNHNARVSTDINTCTNPAILSLKIDSDFRSVSTFVAGNQQEIRTIGTEYFPLQLQVKFREVDPIDGGYHAEACLHTLRTGNVTCFMNGIIRMPYSDSCAPHKPNNNGFPILLLCVILATCLLMVTVAVVAMVHRFYSSQRAHGSRKPSRLSMGKSQPPYASLMEAGLMTQKFGHHEERLSAIAEVDDEKEEKDEKDDVSIGSSSGFESGPPTKSVSEEFTNTTEISDARPFLPLILSEKRRQSQPLLFPPTSPTMETFKPTSLVPVKLQRHSIVVQHV